MRVEHLNPFSEACGAVVRALFGSEHDLGALAVRPDLATTQAINLASEISGDLQGMVMLGMSLAAADRIAAKILKAPVVTFDAEGSIAIAEFGCMVHARAAELLAAEGFACTISAPAVIRGKNAKLNSSEAPALTIPVNINGLGSIEISVSVQDQRQQVA